MQHKPNGGADEKKAAIQALIEDFKTFIEDDGQGTEDVDRSILDTNTNDLSETIKKYKDDLRMIADESTTLVSDTV